MTGNAGDQAPWQARPEAGARAGLWIVERCASWLGRRAAHWLVVPVAAYFLLVRAPERRASADFLARALGRQPGVTDLFRHFLTFARVAVDRLFLLRAGAADIPLAVVGREQIEATLATGQGCILLSAHLGSFEAGRQVGLRQPALRLRLVLDRAVNAQLVAVLERAAPEFAASLLDASGDPRGLVLRIGECLAAGEWVGWLGDRYRGGERTVSADFLGRPARFPASPFIVAQLYGVPVYLMLALARGRGYEIHVEQIWPGGRSPRGERDARVAAGVAAFARALSGHARREPYNWFNFYDFWSA